MRAVTRRARRDVTTAAARTSVMTRTDLVSGGGRQRSPLFTAVELGPFVPDARDLPHKVGIAQNASAVEELRASPWTFLV
jgi:hypothetical protein